MARRSWEDVGGVPLAIINGEHDDVLTYIQQACGQRVKRMFRVNQRVKLVGTKNPLYEGKQGRVEKVNVKTISVMLEDGVGLNCSPSILEVVV